MFKKWIFRFLIGVLYLGLASCSGSASNTGGTITVTMTADEYSFTSSMTTFVVGQKYHFEVTNNGQVPHEVMLVKPIEAGTMDMEEMDEMALAHIEEDDLPAGATSSMDYTFTEPAPAGTLEFACHLTGHYEAGMVLPIVVQ